MARCVLPQSTALEAISEYDIPGVSPSLELMARAISSSSTLTCCTCWTSWTSLRLRSWSITKSTRNSDGYIWKLKPTVSFFGLILKIDVSRGRWVLRNCHMLRNNCTPVPSQNQWTFSFLLQRGALKPARVIVTVAEKQPLTAHLGVASGHATYFVACPMSKNATSTLAFGDFEIITNSDGQTVVSP